MEYILVALIIGIIAGIFVPKRFLKANSKLQVILIAALLFAMGLSLSSAPNFLENILNAGFSAMIFALATVLASIAAVYPVSRFILKHKRHGKEEER